MPLKLKSLPARVAIGYAIVAALWILLSDKVLGAIVSDPARLTFWATVKGWFFVAVTAGLLFAMLRREINRGRMEATRRGDAESALVESEARFRLIADTINEVFWIRDPVNQRFIYVSPGYERIWGQPAATLIESPRAWLEAILPEDRDKVLELTERRELAGEQDVEFRISRPDGGVHWIHAKTFPVTDRSGTVTRTVGIAQDVTARKRMEEQFLHGQRLESLGRLAGGVAHDLNNILAPILMGSSMLKHDGIDPEDVKLVEMIETAAHRGAGIIRQLLTFSRGVEGPRTLVQVRHVLKETLVMVRETFPRNVTADLRAPADLWPVRADATLLHQVIMNLCVNARDAMPKGGRLVLNAENRTLRDVDVAGIPDAQPGPHVVVSVSDTGEGINAANRARIFDPFFTTKGEGRGTGLGLATVLGIVKSHGGFVTVESDPGHGASFEVHLPATPDTTVAEESGMETTSVIGHGEQVLIVDDEPVILETARRALEEANFRVLTARNGREAIGLFLEHRYEVQLVVTDLMMPVMDGVALIRALRPLDKNVPFIATSGLSDEDKAAELKVLGVNTVLEKPFSVSALRRAVASAIHASSELRFSRE